MVMSNGDLKNQLIPSSLHKEPNVEHIPALDNRKVTTKSNWRDSQCILSSVLWAENCNLKQFTFQL